MNRVTITLTPNGEIARICSDEPIECYWVSPHTPQDRVYLFDAVYTGPQFVREEIGGYAVGHANDGTLGGSGTPISPKLPASRPALRAISDHDDPRPDGEPLRAGTNDAPIVPREPTKAMTDAAKHVTYAMIFAGIAAMREISWDLEPDIPAMRAALIAALAIAALSREGNTKKETDEAWLVYLESERLQHRPAGALLQETEQAFRAGWNACQERRVSHTSPLNVSVIPCYRGGHLCNWPACSPACDGRPGANADSTLCPAAPIVPREPTKAMTDAAIHDYIGRKPMTPSAHYAAMWRAMHDAATGIGSE